MKYHHLDVDERVELYADLKSGVSLRSVARKLRRSPSSLCRELKRHTRYGRVYKPVLANKRAIKWSGNQRSKAPLKTAEILNYVHTKLKLGWSPETIAGRLKLDHPNSSTNYESIYRWIYSKKWRKDKLWQHLECGHKRRRINWGRRGATYTKVLDTKSINLRPNIANHRLQIGHGETDLMESGRDSSAALSVTVDRSTRFTRLVKVPDKTARSKTHAMARSLPFGLVWLTMTADRGSENKSFSVWETRFNLTVFFCTAYHSWEKGTVENTIKRVRRFIPKGENIANYSWRDIQRIENWINHKPMKCLQYLTPYEKMRSVTQSLESKK